MGYLIDMISCMPLNGHHAADASDLVCAAPALRATPGVLEAAIAYFDALTTRFWRCVSAWLPHEGVPLPMAI